MMKIYILSLLLVVSLQVCKSSEVQKDFVVKNWWNRFLLWLVSRFQDKYESQLSICSLSLYPPFEDINLLELMLNMRFGQQNRRKSPGTTLPTLKSTPIPLPKSKRSAAEELASIVEEQSHEVMEDTIRPTAQLATEPIVRILPSGRVCFGVHELSHRVPKDATKRREFVAILNSFITYVNHQNIYPTKIHHLEN